MVLNDGETYTSIQGCQIVEIFDDMASDDDIDGMLEVLNKCNGEIAGADILGGFDEDGQFLIGDPRTPGKKKVIKLDKKK